MEFREEDYIVNEDSWVIVTRDGWTKRQKSFTDVASIRVRDDDKVGWVYRARARQTITFFTDRGVGYTLRVNDIPMTTGHGEPIQKQFAFEDQEHIVGVICHDPRCLPDPSKYPQTGPRLVQRLLADELEAAPTRAGRPQWQRQRRWPCLGQRRRRGPRRAAPAVRDRADGGRQGIAVSPWRRWRPYPPARAGSSSGSTRRSRTTGSSASRRPTARRTSAWRPARPGC